MTFTTAEKAKEARREVVQRRRVYERLISNGKMTRETADRQIAIMQAIADDYERQAIADEPQGALL